MFATLLNLNEFLNCIELIAFLLYCHVSFRTLHMRGKTNFGIRFILSIFLPSASNASNLAAANSKATQQNYLNIGAMHDTLWLASPTDKSKAQTIRLKCERECGRE